MLPFDNYGEYTPEEIRDVLSGVKGSRNMTYHYALLNQNNDRLGTIDYVQAASIENNALADIKRTAKFEILDTGTINYLQDRIMPYIRLHMPEDETYRDHVRSLDPAIWWRMDDKNKAAAATASSAVTDGNTLNTQSSALLIDPVKTTTISNIKTSPTDPNIRDEFWQYIEVTDSEPLMFVVTAGTANTTEIYTAPALDGELTLVKTRQHTVNGFSPEYFRFPFPTRGFYFVKLTGENAVTNVPTIVTSRPSRLEDSSNNHIVALGLNLPLNGSPLLSDNGTSYTTSAGGGNTWGANDLNVPLAGGLAINYWYKHTQTGTQSVNLNADINTESMRVNLMYVDQPASQSWIELKVIPKDGSVEDVEYSRVFDWDFAKFRNAAHMFTFVVAPDASTTTVYVDGVVERVLTNTIKSTTFDHVRALSSDTIDSVEFDFSGSGTVALDDMTIYSKPLTPTDVSKMYAMGVGVTAGERRGYIDWPQGVFVLSSPTRTMEDGNVVTREVEGYDQLVVLKEDSFDYRYSVKAGAKYTEAISAVVQSSKPIVDYPLDETWTIEGSAVIDSENSAQLDTVDAEQAAVYSNMVTLQDIQVSARMDAPTSPPTARTIMAVNYWTTIDGEAKQLWIEKSGTTIEFVYNNFGWASTWNAVNDAYWRLRESDGFFYFETSANRQTWVVRRKVKLSDDTFADANVSFVANHGGAVIGSGAHEISFTGRGKASMDITKSESKLLTAMEWEPGTPKLTIVNDLLAAINYQSATYDERGGFLARPYVSPAVRTPQYRYATDAESVITGDVEQTVDLFKVPNKWIVVVSDPDRPALIGEYTNDDPHSPTSTVSRGRVIVDSRTEQSAPDQVTLDAQAARLAFEASQVYEAIEFKTWNMPIHQNSDVYELVIDGLGIDGKYSEQSWSMELKNGAMMSHKVRKVVSV